MHPVDAIFFLLVFSFIAPWVAPRWLGLDNKKDDSTD